MRTTMPSKRPREEESESLPMDADDVLLKDLHDAAPREHEHERNYVGEVNEWCQDKRNKRQSPNYTPDSTAADKSHTCTIAVEGFLRIRGREKSSIKLAKHDAALIWLTAISHPELKERIVARAPAPVDMVQAPVSITGRVALFLDVENRADCIDSMYLFAMNNNVPLHVFSELRWAPLSDITQKYPEAFFRSVKSTEANAADVLLLFELLRHIIEHKDMLHVVVSKDKIFKPVAAAMTAMFLSPTQSFLLQENFNGRQIITMVQSGSAP